jgi:hypothetical protein
MKRLFAVTTLACLFAGPAFADVTIKTTVEAASPMPAGELVQYIKGTKARFEMTIGNRQFITILDAGGKRLIMLDPATKQARIVSFASALSVSGAKPAEAKISFEPTGQTRQILDQTCTQYMFSMTVPQQMGQINATVEMSGPTWIAKGAPGTSDFESFYRIAIESGALDALEGQPGAAMQPGVSQMYKALLKGGGIPYEQQVHVVVQGTGPIPEMMQKGVTTTTRVTEVSTKPIVDSMFEIPDGYRIASRQQPGGEGRE